MKAQKRLGIRGNQPASISKYIRSYDIWTIFDSRADSQLLWNERYNISHRLNPKNCQKSWSGRLDYRFDRRDWNNVKSTSIITQKRLETRENQPASVNAYKRSSDIQLKSWQPADMKRETRYILMKSWSVWVELNEADKPSYDIRFESWQSAVMKREI